MSTATHTGTANSLLQSLSAGKRSRLLAGCKQVSLTYGDVLDEPGKQIRHVYFPNDGIISLLTPVDGYGNVEVGLVGNEGMAGLPLFLGIGVSPVRSLVQGSGTAMRMRATAFRDALKRSPELAHSLNHYLYVFMAQIAQTAACNRHHLLEQRLARWLLMTHDRTQSSPFRLTQEFLAHMLGVRRAGVTQAAGALQKKKLISYRRGHITVLNRKGLERASCRCYRAVNEIRDRMLG